MTNILIHQPIRSGELQYRRNEEIFESECVYRKFVKLPIYFVMSHYL